MRWSWFIFVIFPWISDGYRILCLLPYAGKSHHMVFEPLLKELTARGHHLTVVSFFPPATPQRNRRDVSLVGLAPLNVEVVDLKMLDFHWYGLERYLESIPPIFDLANANLQFCRKLLDAEVFEEFLKTKGDYDLILTEHFNSDCMLGIIHKYGLPSIGLQSCAMLPWTYSRVGAPDNPSYVPGMTLTLTDEMTFVERIENTFFLYFCLIWFEIEIRWEEQKLLEAKLGPLPALEDIGKNASIIIVNTHHSINGNRIVPPSVVEVGGIHLYNRTVKTLPQDLDKWVSEAKDGFIIFSFGSLVRGSTIPEDKLKAITKVLSLLPQRVLWKWESEENIESIFPSNVRPVRWLPQYDLLHHPNCVAFITHGGLLSFTEAVSAGVPMLMVPILGDQFGNAAHAKKAGIAEVLRLQDINEDSLYTALLKILSPTPEQLYEILAGTRGRDRQSTFLGACLRSGGDIGQFVAANREPYCRNGHLFFSMSNVDVSYFGSPANLVIPDLILQGSPFPADTRTQAKRIRSIWMDRPQSPMDTAIFHIERTARHKLSNLSSEGRWLNRLQLMLLDVAAFFILLIGLPLYLTVKIISKKCKRKLKQS